MGDFGTGGSGAGEGGGAARGAGRAGELLLALGDNAYEAGTEQEFQDHLFTPMAALLRKCPCSPARATTST